MAVLQMQNTNFCIVLLVEMFRVCVYEREMCMRMHVVSHLESS